MHYVAHSVQIGTNLGMKSAKKPAWPWPRLSIVIKIVRRSCRRSESLLGVNDAPMTLTYRPILSIAFQGVPAFLQVGSMLATVEPSMCSRQTYLERKARMLAWPRDCQQPHWQSGRGLQWIPPWNSIEGIGWMDGSVRPHSFTLTCPPHPSPSLSPPPRDTLLGLSPSVIHTTATQSRPPTGSPSSGRNLVSHPLQFQRRGILTLV